jgi:hypothetical protein
MHNENESVAKAQEFLQYLDCLSGSAPLQAIVRIENN